MLGLVCSRFYGNSSRTGTSTKDVNKFKHLASMTADLWIERSLQCKSQKLYVSVYRQLQDREVYDLWFFRYERKLLVKAVVDSFPITACIHLKYLKMH